MSVTKLLALLGKIALVTPAARVGSDCIAAALHGSKSTAFCEAEARDDKGALLAKVIGTFKLLSEKEKKGN